MNRCRNRKLSKLLDLYQLELLEESVLIQIEHHLLECDVCFQKVYVMNPVFNLIEEIPQYFLEELPRSYSNE